MLYMSFVWVKMVAILISFYETSVTVARKWIGSKLLVVFDLSFSPYGR